MIAYGTELDDAGNIVAGRLWAADGSWAAVDGEAVVQTGPQRLWDAVESAYAFHVKHDRPGLDRYGLTITGNRQWTWLDAPAQPVPVSGPVQP